jgi:rhodanese-related sulfurtransferase
MRAASLPLHPHNVVVVVVVCRLGVCRGAVALYRACRN